MTTGLGAARLRLARRGNKVKTEGVGRANHGVFGWEWDMGRFFCKEIWQQLSGKIITPTS